MMNVELVRFFVFEGEREESFALFRITFPKIFVAFVLIGIVTTMLR